MASYGYKPVDKLFRDINSAVPGASSTQVLVDGSLRVNYPTDLDAYSKDNLDKILADLGYVALAADSAVQLTSVKLTDQTLALEADWTTLGGCVIAASKFSADLSKVFGQLVGQILTVDGDAEIQLVETQDRVDVVLATAKINSQNEWLDFTTDTTVELRLGQSSFRLDGRLGTASSAKVQFASLALMEIASG